MADHGINVSRADTAVATPNAATCGIPFVIGTAPLSKATGTAATAGTPVLCTGYTEAEEQLGYDDDWAKYTVCEVMHYHFKLCACQPVIFLPLAENAEAAAVAAAVEQVEACLTMFGMCSSCAASTWATRKTLPPPDMKSRTTPRLWRRIRRPSMQLRPSIRKPRMQSIA